MTVRSPEHNIDLLFIMSQLEIAYWKPNSTVLPIYVRAAADLEDHIKPALPMLPFGLKPVTNPGSSDQSDDTELFSNQSYKEKNSEFSRFCKALRTIEKERIKMRERLQVTRLPVFS